MSEIKGYITDLDGTLFDTRTANIVSYEHAFRDAGLEFDAAKYDSAFGLRYDAMMDIVAPSSTAVERKIVQENKKRHYSNNLDLVRVNEGLTLLLTQLKKDGHKIGLATTAQSANGRSVLRYFVLESLFDEILYGDEVQKGKPDPECYNKIISMLNLKPSECLIFEDSESGIRAALAAGASVMRITI